MAGVDQSKTFPHLLSQQLHGLSELAEMVTLRLLELEERVQQLEEENPFDDNSIHFSYEGPEMPRDIPESDDSSESESEGEVDLEDI